MSGTTRLSVIAALSFLCCSCSSSAKKPVDLQRPAEVPGAPQVGRGAITLLIKADPQLNRYNRSAHTLFVCLYQLKDPMTFSQLAKEREGLSRLMECDRFDGSMVNAKHLVVQPGQEVKDVHEHAEGARYLGIAAGYFGTGKERMIELLPLSSGHGDTESTVSLELGAHQIQSAKVK